MGTLRWGLMGTARINRSVIPAIRASARSRLAAVASRTAERAAAYAAEWDIPRAHGSYEALLADPEVDAVYVPLPNHLHVTWAIRAAEAGKHVLCEKPLALTPVAVDALAAAARRAGVVVAEAFMYRHHPRTERVKALIDGGTIGTLQFIHGAFTFPLTRPEDIRWDPAQGGGSLWDVGCYPVHFMRYVAGEPTEVFGTQVTGETGVDVHFAGQLRFANGVLAQFDSGFRSPFRMEMTFVGSTGVLTVPRAFKPDAAGTLYLRREEDEVPLYVPGPAPLYLGEVDDLAAAVLDGTPPRLPLAESRAQAAVLATLRRAAEAGRPLPVED